MKRRLLAVVCSTICAYGICDEAELPELKEPFLCMTTAEQQATGITKLSTEEQSALVAWMKEYKERPPAPSNAPKEVSISEILEGGKVMVFSDGTKLTFDASARKKSKQWAVGDKIAIGSPGRRGGLNIYHLATGAKVKAFRDQAPTTAVTKK